MCSTDTDNYFILSNNKLVDPYDFHEKYSTGPNGVLLTQLMNLDYLIWCINS